LQCQTNLGHGDAIHVGELIVGKPPAVFTVHEGLGGYDVHDVATCNTYVKVTGGDDNGRGVADYVLASNTKAATFWSSTSPDRYSADDGRSLGKKSGSTNFLIYWDADETRELEDGTGIAKLDGGSLLSCSACASNNGTKSTPTLTADLFGDWREEIVWRQSDNQALRIYTTTALTKRRLYTLMHDPTYRAQVSFEQSAYNQPPHVGFHIGAGMVDPPKPDMRVAPRAK
jgi:rhamnogalacturonan endolyase